MLRLLPCLLVFPTLAQDPELPPWSDKAAAEIGPTAEWPELDRESRPWLRWRWPATGSLPPAPESPLKAVAEAGFGGVEIVPTGPDPAMIWPDAAWIERCGTAAEVCAELGLGFDLAMQGGPVPRGAVEEAREVTMTPFTTRVAAGVVDLELPAGQIDCMGAWPRQGSPIDLFDFVDPATHRLVWEAPPGTWSIHGAILQPASQHLDPFSPAAALDRLNRLETSFMAANAPYPRARTLERTVSGGSNWSRALIDAFPRFRGYDLREELPTLLGDASPGTVERVLSDYRETLDDLRYETLLAWHEHTRERGSLTRSLLAGGPGHPLDVHAVADIPGTLVEVDHDSLPPIAARFASSAAHLTYKPISQGSFRTDDLLTPALLKRTADHLWLAGANQLILDGLGTEEIKAPLDPGKGLWRHIQAFTSYVDRCQSVLQTGAPDPDLLLYFPAHDFHVERDGLPDDPAARQLWLEPTGFYRAASEFDRNGVVYDIVSDRLLRDAVVANGRIILGGLAFKGIVLPEVRRLPETTATRLLDLARAGARIGVLGEWPRDVPGLPSPDIRRGTLISAIQAIPNPAIVESSSPTLLAEEIGVDLEVMTRHGLRFVRRSHADGHHYFVVNTDNRPLDQWIPLARPATSIRLLDPRFPERSGFTEVRNEAGKATVRLQLDPGESRILRTYHELQPTDAAWKEFVPEREPVPIAGMWNIEFLEGGPVRPKAVASPVLGSWKTLADPAAETFTGVARYTIEFELPDPGDGHWQLDLGGVAHSAEIHLNGLPAGIAFAPPHRFDVGPLLKPGTNTLSIRVANLLAPGHPELPAGLLGPVRLVPLVAADTGYKD